MSKTEVNSININYEIKGEGYPVVLIHGLAEDLHYWNAFFLSGSASE